MRFENFDLGLIPEDEAIANPQGIYMFEFEGKTYFLKVKDDGLLFVIEVE